RVVDFMVKNPVSDPTIPGALFRKPGWFGQMKLYLRRDIDTKRTNKQYLSLVLFEAPLLALILSFFMKYAPDGHYTFSGNDNIPSFLFMSMVIALFVGMSLSAEEIFRDRRILKREQFLHLSRGAYFSSKILLMFLLSAFQMLAYVAVSYLILDIRGLTFSTWAILFSTACFANVLGLNLSSGLNSIVSIYVAIPLILVPQLLFSGLIVDFTKMHASMNSYRSTPIVADIMASRWSYEALAVDRFMNNRYQKQVFQLEQEKNDVSFKTFYWIPEVQKNIDMHRRSLSEGKIQEANERIPLIENAFQTLDTWLATSDDSLSMAIHQLAVAPFNPENVESYDRCLDQSNDRFFARYEQINSELDRKYLSLTRSLGGSPQLQRFRNRYTNRKLEDLVRDTHAYSRLKVIDNQIVQADESIYRMPQKRNGQAHFYAPCKYLGSLKIGTPLFNILVMWIFTFFLIVSLYFDLLRKALAYVERWRLIRQAILREKIFDNPMAFIKGEKK
nr:ABC transporter permease [Prolixibacteraceae bacterium]